MSTKTILKNIDIKDDKAAERLISALEESENKQDSDWDIKKMLELIDNLPCPHIIYGTPKALSKLENILNILKIDKANSHHVQNFIEVPVRDLSEYCNYENNKSLFDDSVLYIVPRGTKLKVYGGEYRHVTLK
ncbi:hypothetical protein M3F36_016555 [Clostridioides difficile]|uniref:hypothetical protein n=1 Tax=Clostridioides difficile TaxID=1496 RepID=UPI00093BC0BA|nr:hypothetical protein [Clostridioides difficile]MBJ9760985.1 hypothetical protein [Clostridioides difficile]MBJ9789760.1 hypothetical protein [Clostridioides difficile]MBN5923805.1 hypothetical protein [Clostridioides difficile]MCL6801982.1 hypothetical protein [Clostridioides difficile]SJP35929.1 Uncharacterised protein [Clostridioides difficile]